MKKIIALLLITVAGFAFKNAENGYKAGDTAADFKLKNVTGKQSLEKFIQQHPNENITMHETKADIEDCFIALMKN